MTRYIRLNLAFGWLALHLNTFDSIKLVSGEHFQVLNNSIDYNEQLSKIRDSYLIYEVFIYRLLSVQNEWNIFCVSFE